eukprot:564757-Rhodomonas_salina.1
MHTLRNVRYSLGAFAVPGRGAAPVAADVEARGAFEHSEREQNLPPGPTPMMMAYSATPSLVLGCGTDRVRGTDFFCLGLPASVLTRGIPHTTRSGSGLVGRRSV